MRENENLDSRLDVGGDASNSGRANLVFPSGFLSLTWTFKKIIRN
jgi:hypothetical protein